jgi:lysophospholipase L1-like esterase
MVEARRPHGRDLNVGEQVKIHCSGVAIAGTAVLGMLLSGCARVEDAVVGQPLKLKQGSELGRVMGAQQPVSGTSLQLYAVGTNGDGSAATPLLSSMVLTDGSGSFSLTGAYTCPGGNPLVYLVATGGNPGSGTNPNLALTAALGPCGGLSAMTYISVNELTTIASVASLVGYMSGYANVGSLSGDLPGLTSGFAQVSEYTDISLGAVPGPALPSGYSASSAQILSLGDVVASCVNSTGGSAGDGTACGNLFLLATPPNGTAPRDTVAAVLNILQYPTQNVAALYSLMAPAAPFQPTLKAAPANWNLAILPTPPPLTFNATLNASTAFMGASIIQNWPMPVNNFGISGQTSAQVLSRFQSTVVGHGYARVVILVGTNDVLDSTAGFPDEAVSNIAAMATMAKDAGMEVVLSELPPLTGANAGLNSQILGFNTALAGLAAKQGYLIVDYYTPLSGHPEDFVDGIHPNAAGYTIMEQALAAVVTR